jgi:hypothetical protein
VLELLVTPWQNKVRDDLASSLHSISQSRTGGARPNQILPS